jgi:PBSX family phage terminase large subunit
VNPAGVRLSVKQERSIVEARDARISIWAGAVRSGKTISSLIAFLMAVAEVVETDMPGLVVVAGRTLQTIERNLIEPLQDPSLFGPLAAHVHHTRGSSTAVILGRTVHLIGASDVRAEGRLRGLTACLAYADEATLMPQGFWTQLLARLSVPGARLLATTNPDNQAHWLRKDYILREGELNLRHWHFALDDNPSLTPEYVAAIKAENVGIWFRRNVLGEWCSAEGAIYDMWDPGRHVVDIMPPISKWIALGIDHGTTAPFAAILLGLGVNRKLYLAAEWRYDSRQAHRQMTDTEYSRKIREFLAQVPIPATQIRGVQPHYVVVDPAAAGFRTQLASDGMNPVLANNAVLDGIRCVSSLLALGHLMVHRSCVGLANEIGGYAWDDRAAQMGEDKPVKVDDHSCDAARYALFTTKSAWGTVIPLTSPVSGDAWAQAV